MSFGEQIRLRRSELRLTRAELAERYRALSPPRKMLPNQKKLWKALSGR